MKIIIRDADKHDTPIIVQLIRELAAIEGDQSRLDDDYVDKYLSDPNVGILIAEIDSEPAGLLSYSLRPNLYHAGIACLIDELIVSKKIRGKGTGTALITELLRQLKDMKCIEVSVAVMPDNLKAKSFYQKHGFSSEISLLERHVID